MLEEYAVINLHTLSVVFRNNDREKCIKEAITRTRQERIAFVVRPMTDQMLSMIGK